MDRQIRTWKTAAGERLWLSMLIAAMEQTSEQASQNCQAPVCEHAELARLRSQLACPASPYPFGGPAYSLRN